MSQLTILVSGVTGFIGNYVVQKFKARDIKIIEIGRTASGFSDEFIQFDFAVNVNSNQELAMKMQSVDFYLHFAGSAHKRLKSIEDIDYSKQVNGNGAKRIIDVLSLCDKVPKIIVASSVAVYGQTQGIDISSNSTSKPQPSDTYGVGKLAAEGYFENFARKNASEVAILRLPLVIGRNAPGSLLALSNAIKRKRFFYVSDRESLKSWIGLEDIFSYINYLIFNKFVEGTYNVTSGKDVPLAEIALAIASETDSKKPYSVPYSVLKLLALSGDALQVTGIESPFNSDVLSKLSGSLTFKNEASLLCDWTPKVELAAAIAK